MPRGRHPHGFARAGGQLVAEAMRKAQEEALPTPSETAPRPSTNDERQATRDKGRPDSPECPECRSGETRWTGVLGLKGRWLVHAVCSSCGAAWRYSRSNQIVPVPQTNS